jgi:hypothetical protein
MKLLNLFNKNNRLMAEVQCIKCKKNKTMRASDLFNKKQTSCRCQIIKHGLYETKIYSIYNNMKDRCLNNNNHAYKDYGGKGIEIYSEWLDKEKGFINFYNWAIEN